MWFEVALLYAGFVCICAKAKYDPTAEVEKQNLLVWAATPALYLLFFQKTCSIRILLIGYLVGFFILCRRSLMGIVPRINILFLTMAKLAIVVLLYVFVLKNYIPDAYQNELGQEEVLLLFTGLSALFLFSGNISRRISRIFNKKEALSGSLSMLLPIIVPVLGFYMIERPFNKSLEAMQWQFAVGNILWLAALFFVCICLFSKKKVAAVFYLTVCMVFGVGNYFIAGFRGSPIMPNDFLSVGTAFQVAGGYEIQVEGQAMAVVLSWYAIITVLCCLPAESSNYVKVVSYAGKADYTDKADYTVDAGGTSIIERTIKTCGGGYQGSTWIRKAIAVGIAGCISLHYLSTVHLKNTYDWEMNLWDVGFSYRTAGSALGFTTMLQDMKVEQPDGYSSQKVDEILQAYRPQEVSEGEKADNHSHYGRIIQ